MVRLIINKDKLLKGSKSASQEKLGQKSEVKVLKERKMTLGWLSALSPGLRQKLCESSGSRLAEFEEIRLRIGRPLILRLGQTELTIDNDNRLSSELKKGYIISKAELERNLEILSQGSLYAWEDEFKNGYLTIPGGHRVGFVGRGVLDKGVIRTIRDISGFNYRISREVPGCADEVLPYVIENQHVFHTLIISPPQCGKTTLLRDMVCQISDGIEKMGFGGVNVGLVDERSELAGIYEGQPQFHIGLRTDVLDACPKAQGMIMLIRSMSPRVVATDEIGKPEDVEAVYEALQTGVSVLTTIHGSNLEEIKKRPFLRKLLNWQFFERIVLLSRRDGPGTIEAVYDGKTLERMK